MFGKEHNFLTQDNFVSLHFRIALDCIRAPPRRGRYWEIHPRRPKDFPRPERFPEGEARGKSRGSREIWRAEGMDFPIPPEFWWSTDNLSASIFLQGVDQKILPCGQGRIDSVKINPSLLMMTDCRLPPLLFCGDSEHLCRTAYLLSNVFGQN